MSEALVQARALQSELRCVYCHERIDGRVFRCGGCHTALHPECRQELAVCPALGCAHELEGAKEIALPPRRLGAWVVFAIASALGVGGVVAVREALRARPRVVAPPPGKAGASVSLRALVDVLARDPEPERRRAAASALARDLERHGLVARRREVLALCPALARALGDDDGLVRLHAARALSAYGRWVWLPGPEGQVELLAAAQDGDPRVRRVALACLGAVVPPRAAPSELVVATLARGLSDEDGSARAAALVVARALLARGNLPRVAVAGVELFARWTPPLARAAQAPRTQAAALAALAALSRRARYDDLRSHTLPGEGRAAAIGLHTAALLAPLRDALGDVRLRADAVALAQSLQLGPEQAGALHPGLKRAWDAAPELRPRIAPVLGRLGAVGVEQLLEGFADPDPLLRAICGGALARTQTARARSELLAGLGEPERERAAAAGLRALTGIGASDLPALKAGLRAREAATRLAVVGALGRTAAPGAVPLLAAALADRYRDVRLWALERLNVVPAAQLRGVRAQVEACAARSDLHPRERAAAQAVLKRAR